MSLSICFVIRIEKFSHNSPEKEESFYQEYVKPVFSFLYANPQFSCAISFSGESLEWYERCHPEVISIICELIGRKQVEIIGGGYYDPVFPLIFPIDRTGQIELLTTALRKATGRRPRGAWIPFSAWDSSLVSSLKTCGMEYVLLKASVVMNGETGQQSAFDTYILEDMGKSILVIPDNDYLLPDASKSVSEYSDMLKICSKDKVSPVFCCSVSPQNLKKLIECGWISDFLSHLTEETEQYFTTPSAFLKNNESYLKLFINSTSEIKNLSAKVLMQQNPVSLNYYSRMLLANLEINQFRGDKIRKKNARNEFWKAQNGHGFFNAEEEAFETHRARDEAYHQLLSAERAIDQNASIKDGSCTSFDFDSDGYREYIARFPNYSAFVSLFGGSVFELDVFSCMLNFCCKAYCTGEIFIRKIFSDYFSEKDVFPENSLLNIRYKEVAFSRSKHEVILTAKTLFGKMKQPLSLRKKIIFTDGCIQVQYIIKNESFAPVKCFFGISSDFSIPDFDTSSRKIDIVDTEGSKKIEAAENLKQSKDITCVQISDENINNVFVFEPNESSGILISAGEAESQAVSTRCVFYWPLTISPSYEVEKTLFLNIKSPSEGSLSKKGRQKKNGKKA